MGCGGSKSESGREGVTSKLSPLLRRRFEEIRGRRDAAERGTLSKKELLKEGMNEDDHESISHSGNLGNDNDNNHIKSLEESNLRVAKMTPEKEPEAETFEDAVADVKGEEKASVEEHEEGQNGEEGEEEDEDEEEVCRLSNVDFRNEYICPSSPSFRVYCIESSDNSKDDDDSKDDDETSQSQKSQGDLESGEIVALVNPNVASEKKLKEKGKKGKRFKMVMGKGRRPAAIKSLMKVTSCYHPSGSRHDKAHLLTPKPEAS